jgi:hypothetical protein
MTTRNETEQKEGKVKGICKENAQKTENGERYKMIEKVGKVE